MTPTLCKCGGHRDRCECAYIRREAFAEAAAWHVERRDYWVTDTNGFESDNRVRSKVHRQAAVHFTRLAAPPGRID